MDDTTQRRDILAAALLAMVPLAAGEAEASKLNPAQTMVTPPGKIAWMTQPGFPPKSVEMGPLFGSLSGKGLYYTLVRWYPGYMSAPHSYRTDRLCVVVSGTWWVNSGADFDPASCIPVPPGTFIRRVARTPHYDGVIKTAPEPVVIAICGMAPVDVKWLEAGKPNWREV
jgi:hypothetical protein